MNKTEFVKAVADKAELSNKDASKVVEAFIEVVTETLSKGDEIALTGFGAFSISERKARTARDFRNGNTINVPACKVAKFRAGKILKDAIN